MSVWAALRGGLGFAQLLQTVVGDAAADLTSLPAFAIAVPESDGFHVAVRGPLSVRAMTAPGPVRISGADVLTWREDRILAPSQLSLADNEDSGQPSWVLNDGMAPVCLIEVLFEAEPTPAPVVVQRVEPSTTSNGVLVTDTPSLPVPTAEAPSLVESGVVTSALGDEAKASVELGADVPAPSGEPSTPVQSRDEQDLHYTTLYRSFFEDPAARNPVPETPVPDAADVHAETQMTIAPPSNTETNELVIPTTDLPYGDADDHDGMTVMSVSGSGDDHSTDHDEMTTHTWVGDQVAAGPQPPPVLGPMVSARVCPHCHTPNSTRRVTCRACDAPLDVDATQVPRPILGRLKLPGGDVRPIDHPFVIGRRPEATRFSNLDIPNLITIDDPHVSATHLRVDLEDWSVLVTSLGRNGTILRRAGEPDRRLTDGQQEIAQEQDIYFLSHDLMVSIEELA